MRPLAHAGGLFACALATGVGGCSGGVEVAPPTGLTPAAEATCRGVSWPQTVGGMARMTTQPSSPLTAAWGEPALIARCGVPTPGPTTDNCIAVDGVDWVAHPLSDGTRMTTFGRQPAVEVLVPREYGPAPLLLPAFDGVVARLSRTGHSCA
jgi:hypothetical protein